jgi:hypothetical protein
LNLSSTFRGSNKTLKNLSIKLPSVVNAVQEKAFCFSEKYEIFSMFSNLRKLQLTHSSINDDEEELLHDIVKELPLRELSLKFVKTTPLVF